MLLEASYGAFSSALENLHRLWNDAEFRKLAWAGSNNLVSFR